MGGSFYIDLFGKQACSPGATVSGSVTLNLENSEKDIEKIDVAFCGKAYIFVPEYEQELMKERCSHVDSDQDQIVEFVSTIWDGYMHSSLKAGTHNFPFTIDLPESLPNSFQLHSKNLHGCYIAYTLKASAIRSKKKAYTTETPITITNEINIKGASFSDMQCVSGKTGKSGIFRFIPSNGCVAMEVTTDRSGYCVGDSIAISAYITNNTRSKISSLQATLNRKIIHKDHCHMNYCSTVKTVESDGTQMDLLLTIPKTSPSITSCRILKIIYELKVKLKLGNKVKIVAFLPITIGTISQDEHLHDGLTSLGMEQNLLNARYPSEETISSTSSSSYLICV